MPEIGELFLYDVSLLFVLLCKVFTFRWSAVEVVRFRETAIAVLNTNVLGLCRVRGGFKCCFN